VLYVEDHPVNIELMQAIFARRPEYTLVVATDGQSGMDAARRLRPDLLLLDINLPDCRGTGLLQRMRELNSFDDVPAVAVTGEHGFDTEGTTFCEMWPKPLRVTDTLSSLDRLLLHSGQGSGSAHAPDRCSARRSAIAGAPR
jgi:CheY-like chemotaxis protein